MSRSVDKKRKRKAPEDDPPAVIVPGPPKPSLPKALDAELGGSFTFAGAVDGNGKGSTVPGLEDTGCLLDARRRAYEESKKKFPTRDTVLSNLSATLDLQFSTPAVPIGNLLNERHESESRLLAVGFGRLEAFADKDKDEDFRDVTRAELDATVTEQTVLVCKPDLSRNAPCLVYKNDRGWRVRDVLAVVLDIERRTRSMTEWFGGIDAHHVMLDGIFIVDGRMTVMWGS